MMKPWAVRTIIILGAVILIISLGWVFLRARSAENTVIEFGVAPGEGFRSIALDLKSRGLIRSAIAFETYTFLAAEARHLKPGYYRLSPAMSAPEIMRHLALGIEREAEVTIPEGSSIFDIDRLLAESGVLGKGQFIELAKKEKLEGYLFPDTYRFYLKSDPGAVIKKFKDGFEANIAPLLPPDPAEAKKVLILASLLEKEVPLAEDRRLVAGILLKRDKNDIGLQVDATVCYAKTLARPGVPCYPVTVLDTRVESPYNTYLHRGWPPGPISNPGTAAVKAALSPLESSYWYYLSDPVTKATIFAKTLDEQEMNRAKYLFSSAR